MRALLHMERRLQDLQRQFENKERIGKIVDVKFDNEKKRWFVKLNDGEDQTPSGQSSGQSGSGSDNTFRSDWLPWQGFSHGTIKMSVPPKKGQHALLRSLGGQAEMAVAEPYHYGPDTPSPHDKQDEIVKLVENEGNSKPTETAPALFGGVGASARSFGPIPDPMAILSAAGIDPGILKIGPNGIPLMMDLGAITSVANQVIAVASDPIGIANAAIQRAIKSAAGNLMGFVQSRLQALLQGVNDAKTDVQHKWLRETNNRHHLIIGKKPEASQKSGASRSQQERNIPDVPKEGAEKTLQILATDKGWLLTHGKSKATLLVNQDDIFIVQEKMSIHVTKLETLISKGESKLSLVEGMITASIKDKSKVSVTEDTIKAGVGNSAVTVRENAVTGNVGAASSIIQENVVTTTVGSGSVSVQDGQVVGKVGENMVIVKDVGAKISADRQYIVVTPAGCFSSKPIVVGPDPVQDPTPPPTAPSNPGGDGTSSA